MLSDKEDKLNLAAKELIKSARSSDVDAKFNTLTQAVNEVKIQGVAQEKVLAALLKDQRLSWALANINKYQLFCHQQQFCEFCPSCQRDSFHI
jgi:hypothetical protein